MPYKICPICGNSFKFFKCEGNRVTCSNKCMGLYRKGKNHPYYKDGNRINIKEKRICLFCGKEYIALIENSKYCSRICGAKANSNNLQHNGIPKEGCIKGGKTHKDKPKSAKFKQLQRERMLKGDAIKARLANSQGETSIEKKLRLFLESNNIPFNQEFIIKGYAFDFKINNTLIECDGNYWHNYPYGTDKDKLKTKLAEAKGFKLLRFWESDIINNFDNVKKEVMANV